MSVCPFERCELIRSGQVDGIPANPNFCRVEINASVDEIRKRRIDFGLPDAISNARAQLTFIKSSPCLKDKRVLSQPYVDLLKELLQEQSPTE